MSKFQDKLCENSCTKPISNVLYHDVINKLHSDNENELLQAIQLYIQNYPNGEYLYIRHKAEKEEGSDHIHILLRNNTASGFTNIMRLRNDIFFHTSKVEENGHKIGDQIPCPNFRISLLGDWLGYALHSPKYFDFLGLPHKKYTYTLEDVKGSESFKNDCIEALNELLRPKLKKYSSSLSDLDRILVGIRQGLTDVEILQSLMLEAFQISTTLKGIRSLRKMTLVNDDTTGFSNAIAGITPYIIGMLRAKGIEKLDKITLSDSPDLKTELSQFELVSVLLTRFVDSINNWDVLSAILDGKL